MMVIDDSLKTQITNALKEHFQKNRETYDSFEKYSRFINIHKSTISNVINEKWLSNQSLISEKKWLEIANAIGLNLNSENVDIKVAETKVFTSITRWLSYLKEQGSVGMLCDEAGVGKSFTCEYFRATNPRVFYIVGSDCDRKNAFIKELARVTGAGTDGKYSDMLDRAIDTLLLCPNPLLIIDEAGDLDDGTMRILKRLYNKLEDRCGIALVGSTDLKKKINRSIERSKNAYEEVFSRFKRKYAEIVPRTPHERTHFLSLEMSSVLSANGITDKTLQRSIISKSYDLRNIKEEIKKIRYK